ncbi:APC family permease [Halobacillus shinanisalinarum]|uniref:APC family permease n=1 Tax=Halobacillus shinanisalinarum TaxID=2932258 RepID=A0ABY4H297_9BACI|nr:APC family permease [Halobacillus shinanisalinarum]UOQ94411.1 APC family permease [Halobacillus shinanisalinarum]
MAKRERQKLQRSLKPHWVWAIAFGSAIGWGAFVLPPDWIGQAGPLGVVIGILLGAILMMIIGVSYGFLIEKFPVTGGEFSYAYIGFGRSFAFLAGWFLTLGYICIVALNASALALLAKFLFPDFVRTGNLYTVAGYDVSIIQVLIASAALIVFALLNIRGTSFSGRTQFVFSMILIFGILLLAGGAIFSEGPSLSNLSPAFLPNQTAIASILTILAIAPFAYVGFDNIPQAAEEFKFEANKAFGLIIWSLLAAGIAYAIMIIVTASTMPWQDLLAQIESQNSVWGTGDAIESYMGRTGVFVIAIAVIMGIFTGLNGFIISSSRLTFAMGRARILPNAFRKLHKKYQTPYVGILFTLAVCLIAPWFGRQALLWVVDMSSTGVAIAYFFCTATAYKIFKWSDKQPDKHSASTVAPGKKLLSLIGMISSIGFLILLLLPQSPASLGKESYIALGIWVVFGIVFYLVNAPRYNKIDEKEMNYLILGKEEL